jgi:hypothetical protein
MGRGRSSFDAKSELRAQGTTLLQGTMGMERWRDQKILQGHASARVLFSKSQKPSPQLHSSIVVINRTEFFLATLPIAEVSLPYSRPGDITSSKEGK